MTDEMAAVVARVASLEMTVGQERDAREAAAAAAASAAQAVQRLGQQMSDSLGRLDARLVSMAERGDALERALDAARAWIGDLATHLDTAQKEANGWVAAEQEARTALEQSFWAMRERQGEAEAASADRPAWEAAVRAEVTALAHLVEDLSAAVFPAPAAPG